MELQILAFDSWNAIQDVYKNEQFEITKLWNVVFSIKKSLYCVFVKIVERITIVDPRVHLIVTVKITMEDMKKVTILI